MNDTKKMSLADELRDRVDVPMPLSDEIRAWLCTDEFQRDIHKHVLRRVAAALEQKDEALRRTIDHIILSGTKCTDAPEALEQVRAALRAGESRSPRTQSGEVKS